ncbi:DNA recombination protein RmuC [Candidatus Microgenomates bacterium]|nr:DNA recombination protein RmuC [Candidatus Microgenomates bacterium]
MDNEIYLLIALVVAGLALIFYLFNKKLVEISEKTKPDETLIQWLKANQNLLQESNKNVSDTLQKNTQAISERLDRAAQVIGALQKEAGQFSEIGRSMRDLQEFLKSPKLRGNIGEEVLRDLIAQMFPKNSFHLQYSFKSGNKVDAALKTDGGLLPIDSKFPMENFQRLIKAETEAEKKSARSAFIADVKKHVKNISEKYILPEEGTMDFALMYIPSEAVFYEVANIPRLVDFARTNRVYPVSPTTLYVHLQTILLSFEGKKLESRSREVFRLLRAIRKDYEKTEGSLSVLSKHLQNAYNQMQNVFSGFTLLGQKLSSTQTLGEGSKKKSNS